MRLFQDDFRRNTKKKNRFLYVRRVERVGFDCLNSTNYNMKKRLNKL
jgi:hypothetical protein